MNFLAYDIAVWIFFVGLYGIVTSRHWVHLIMSLAVLQSSSYVLLLALGYRSGAGAPIFAKTSAASPSVDPVVQALMLTDVVVEVTVIAVLLALAVQSHERHGTADPHASRLLKG